MADDRPNVERRRDVPVITTVAEYDGQASIRISATQLGSDYTPRAAVRVVDEWLEFFEAGPSSIRELEFTSRTPKRLFNSLRSQSQLVRLEVKWGDYSDLAVLAGMTRLRQLTLHGASSVESVDPLRYLPQIEELSIDSLKRASDLSPIGAMKSILNLELGGDWASPQIAHIDSIAFMEAMIKLRCLRMRTIIVDDHDYSPLLRLPNLETVRVMQTRGMRPPIEELQAALPWAR